MATVFCKANYRVKISTRVTSNASLTVANLLATGTGLNLSIITSYTGVEELHQVYQFAAIADGRPEVVNMEGRVPLLFGMDDLCIRARFGTVQNPVVNALLGTSFFDPCICGILSTELKIVPLHSKLVAILLTKTATNLNVPIIQYSP